MKGPSRHLKSQQAQTDPSPRIRSRFTLSTNDFLKHPLPDGVWLDWQRGSVLKASQLFHNQQTASQTASQTAHHVFLLFQTPVYITAWMQFQLCQRFLDLCLRPRTQVKCLCLLLTERKRETEREVTWCQRWVFRWFNIYSSNTTISCKHLAKLPFSLSLPTAFFHLSVGVFAFLFRGTFPCCEPSQDGLWSACRLSVSLNTSSFRRIKSVSFDRFTSFCSDCEFKLGPTIKRPGKSCRKCTDCWFLPVFRRLIKSRKCWRLCVSLCRTIQTRSEKCEDSECFWSALALADSLSKPASFRPFEK